MAATWMHVWVKDMSVHELCAPLKQTLVSVNFTLSCRCVSYGTGKFFDF